VYAAQASTEERTRIAGAVADYIHDSGKANAFRSSVVELGATAIEWPWALAAWRSTDRTVHGEVLLKYMCDQWNVHDLSTGILTQAQRLTLQGVPAAVATKLVADLEELAGTHVAYVKASRPRIGC
jgi:hypothetical protein